MGVFPRASIHCNYFFFRFGDTGTARGGAMIQRRGSAESITS
jgi:hypothetical protein